MFSKLLNDPRTGAPLRSSVYPVGPLPEFGADSHFEQEEHMPESTAASNSLSWRETISRERAESPELQARQSDLLARLAPLHEQAAAFLAENRAARGARLDDELETVRGQCRQQAAVCDAAMRKSIRLQSELAAAAGEKGRLTLEIKVKSEELQDMQDGWASRSQRAAAEKRLTRLSHR